MTSLIYFSYRNSQEVPGSPKTDSIPDDYSSLVDSPWSFSKATNRDVQINLTAKRVLFASDFSESTAGSELTSEHYPSGNPHPLFSERKEQDGASLEPFHVPSLDQPSDPELPLQFAQQVVS